MKRTGAFLIAVVLSVSLIVAMVSCDGDTLSHALIVSSTTGGSVVEPGEGLHTYGMGPGPGCTYEEGEVIDLVAVADEGYRFVEWTGDVGTVVNVTAASTTIFLNDNYSITANFMKTCDLTISSTAGGSVTTPGEGTFTYQAGTVVDLAAEASECSWFGNWTGDVGTVGNVNTASTTITVDGNYSITASFYEGADFQSEVTFRVVDTQGLPVEGATVFVHEPKRTDETGEAVFILPACPLVYSAGKAGYSPVSGTVVVPPDEPIIQEVVLWVSSRLQDIEIIPPEPETGDNLVIRLAGIWSNTCAPGKPDVSVTNVSMIDDTRSILVSFWYPEEWCHFTMTPWEVETDVGQLPAGHYTGFVTYEMEGSYFLWIGIFDMVVSNGDEP